MVGDGYNTMSQMMRGIMGKFMTPQTVMRQMAAGMAGRMGVGKKPAGGKGRVGSHGESDTELAGLIGALQAGNLGGLAQASNPLSGLIPGIPKPPGFDPSATMLKSFMSMMTGRRTS